MRKDTGQIFRIEDYRPSDFIIPTTQLTFVLDGDATVVTAELEIERGEGATANASLVLEGDELVFEATTIGDAAAELRKMRKVLRALGHVTREGVIALKGRAACELNTADELVVGELLMEGVFQDLDAAVAVALLVNLLRVGRATRRVGHFELQFAAPQQRRVALALELGDSQSCCR